MSKRQGLEGALFLMDFHHFFPDAPHALLYERHRGMILNPDLRQLADLVVAEMCIRDRARSAWCTTKRTTP